MTAPCPFVSNGCTIEREHDHGPSTGLFAEAKAAGRNVPSPDAANGDRHCDWCGHQMGESPCEGCRRRYESARSYARSEMS